MRIRILFLIILISSCALYSCGPDTAAFDPIKRAYVDGLNKQAFVCRYKDPAQAIDYAQQALQYLHDSLPDYSDGKLRTWNNLAFCHYMLTQNDLAEVYADSVLSFQQKTENSQVEKVIAKLLMARVLQMACRIADSYQMLYEIEQGDELDRNRENFLYNYAQSEYYIVSLTLNYSYRNGMEASVASQIEEIEATKNDLRCDFAQDLALNYALAYGYSRLCDSVGRQSYYFGRSLDYCIESLEQLTNPQSYSVHELANIVQMLAFLGEETPISEKAWQENLPKWERACSLIVDGFNIPLDSTADLSLQLFEISTELFWQQADPTQRLAACIATGYYCLHIGDTLLAKDYFTAPLSDTILPAAFIPRFEAMLYDGLLLSGAGTMEERIQWYQWESEIQDLIQRNQKADFLLQNQLERSHTFNEHLLIFAIILAVMLLVLIVLVALLFRKQQQLRHETQRLKEAKQQDVERIANVETCLSVLRHDITPFMSYLQNKNLSAELRAEVIDQLIRTFDNIKNWTNLSIPTGLQYKGSAFAIQDVFDQVQHDVNNYRGSELRIVFEPSALEVNADRLLLEIMLRNLVNNAVQHTESGLIHIKAVEENQFVHVSVSDTGKGMSADEVESLFRADKPLKIQGEHSGFGLILCRYIIKKHDDNTLRGCRIWAESQLGEGSTFHFLVAAASK
ncbi:MAG: HAMP domain-containing histidine kinase [Bacteroidales bacterium]|nr:HAMP domain-containing histidine kinase [Bacteroidales bacterium]